MLIDDCTALEADELELPDEFAHVQALLHEADPDLRIRRSAERPDMFVLERRCRRAPAVNTAMRAYTDMHVQARDGYIHVSVVHREWLMHPGNIVIALREEGIDLWAEGGADQVDDEINYEERWQAETRRRRRKEDGHAYYREMFDVLSRIGNGDGTEVSRWQNPGNPAAGTSPAAIVTAP